MGLMRRFKVYPMYHYLEIADVAASELPDWPDERSPTARSAQAILVRTRMDTEGDVEVEVWKDLEAGQALGEQFFSGQLLTTGSVSIGSSHAGQTESFSLPPGWCAIRIYGSPPDEPSSLQISFDSS
jgi:hypothetical protein